MSDTSEVLVVVFWVCAGALFYTSFGYPVLVYILSRVAVGRRKGLAPESTLPRISLLVSAHNEAGIIGSRIENALTADYPKEKLEIVIATDGCSDDTADTARKYAG